MRSGLRLSLAAVAVALVVVPGSPAAPHETVAAGPIQLTIGWAQEPAYTGVDNFVEVDIVDSAGAPVAEPGASLTATVSFGPATVVLALVPGERPGQLRAALVPSRAGTYAIHITGTVRGQGVDVTSTCSDTTFDCVTDVAEIQFPAKDPSPGQMAERLRRETARAAAARSDAAGARRVAVVALMVAALAVTTSAVTLLRQRRAKLAT